MERLPRRSSGLHHENPKHPDRSSARGKACDYSIAMSADLTAARRRIVEGRASAAALVEDVDRRRRSAALGARLHHDHLRLGAPTPPRRPTAPSPPAPTRAALAGLAVSIKDLFDVAGEVSAAASTILADAPPAAADAPATARLRRAGAAFIGRTNMSEFAFSGGRHQPAPRHAGQRGDAGARPDAARARAARPRAARRRWRAAPRGRRSAPTPAARSASRRRCRASSASRERRGWCRSTARCRSRPTLDTVSAITRSVRDAIVLHEILAERARRDQRAAAARAALRGRRRTSSSTASTRRSRARSRAASPRSRRRARGSTRSSSPPLDRIAALNAAGGFPAAESWAFHRRWLAEREAEYDPRVALPDPARRGDERRRLHRPARRPPRLDREHGKRAAGLRRRALADGADGRAAARAAGRRRRGVLRHQRPAAAQPQHRQLPRRLRPQRAVPRRGRAAGRPDGLEHARAATTPCSTPAWRSRPRSPAATVTAAPEDARRRHRCRRDRRDDGVRARRRRPRGDGVRAPRQRRRRVQLRQRRHGRARLHRAVGRARHAAQGRCATCSPRTRRCGIGSRPERGHRRLAVALVARLSRAGLPGQSRPHASPRPLQPRSAAPADAAPAPRLRARPGTARAAARRARAGAGRSRHPRAEGARRPGRAARRGRMPRDRARAQSADAAPCRPLHPRRRGRQLPRVQPPAEEGSRARRRALSLQRPGRGDRRRGASRGSRCCRRRTTRATAPCARSPTATIRRRRHPRPARPPSRCSTPSSSAPRSSRAACCARSACACR